MVLKDHREYVKKLEYAQMVKSVERVYFNCLFLPYICQLTVMLYKVLVSVRCRYYCVELDYEKRK